MGFLAEFDTLEGEASNRLLYDWLLTRHKELFEELRCSRPILEFWSHHPGNPDLPEGTNEKPGSAYLLTRRADVKHALSEFSMRPYRLRDRFILSNDDVDDHRGKREALERALQTPALGEYMTNAIETAWANTVRDVRTGESVSLDVRAFGREVALRFTAAQMGIPTSEVFPARSAPGLADWSEQGYAHFIWKIHARHFTEDAPGRGDVLERVGALVAARLESPVPGTAIARLLSEPGTFSEQDRVAYIVANIVGSIQGLVENVMTGACYALNQMILGGMLTSARVAAGEAARDGTAHSLIALLQEAHRRDTPSPFLPRHGLLSTLPSATGYGRTRDGGSGEQAADFSCAIGAGLGDPRADPDSHDESWDIRMGFGRHRCVGRSISDRLMAGIIARIVSLDNIAVKAPLEKRWGWIVEQFVIEGTLALPPDKERSRFAIQRITGKSTHRPHALSLWSPTPDPATTADFTAWPSLVDRSFSGRHLPPRTNVNTLPSNRDQRAPSENYGAVTELFRRPQGGFEPSRSSMLFPHFAQWFTDSFLRVNRIDRRRNTSNHEIDMCQLYGLTEPTTRLLRTLDGSGMLKSQIGKDGGEYPPALFDKGGSVKREFWQLPYVQSGQYREVLARFDDADTRRQHYFATGLERGNSTFGYTAVTTLFLREHNRLCSELRDRENIEDDERLFQTARMIVTCLLLKVVIEEYINHIAGRPDDHGRAFERPFRFDNHFAEKQAWHRTNRITIEFDLLYRWHSLIPDTWQVQGKEYLPDEFQVNNRPLLEHGLAAVLAAATRQPAGKISLFNTAEFLLPAEHAAQRMSRTYRLRHYNDYCKAFRLPPKKRFGDFSSDSDIEEILRTLYGEVGNVEFLVGLYAEDPVGGSLFGSLMTKMVGYDAFTHALTNPLLAPHIFNKETLTGTGLDTIDATTTLDDIWRRNGARDDHAAITMDYAGPPPPPEAPEARDRVAHGKDRGRRRGSAPAGVAL